MLVKFETKSPRVKGLAFHPKRRWILASLHNGVIQLWDYGEKTLLDKFDEHKGPVRGLDFHKQQPLFVSGGDDAKIKVWNYKSKRCIFTLDAHEDYIRTTYFHHEHPWIISASDDQSIRIWNWQSRSRIAVLTGHTHYVMCAQFHPSKELILSASIDQTIRLWDITALKTKNTSSHTTNKDDINTGLPEILTKTDYTCVESKDAHMSEINWCCFHPDPKKDLCLSAADDNFIKLWRVDRFGLNELYTLRGHYNNVNCAIFHPRKDMVLSASEDRSIKGWNLDKRTPQFTHRKDVDRFWVVAAHPKENLFAGGHDTGLMIFKTERERPVYTLIKDDIFFIKDNAVFKFQLNSRTHPIEIFKLRGRTDADHYYHKLHCYAYNENQTNQFLVSTRSARLSTSVYDLYLVSRSAVHNSEPYRGKGFDATFFGHDKYAYVCWPATVKFIVKGKEREHKSRTNASEITEAGLGRLLLNLNTDFREKSLSLFDIEQDKSIHSLAIECKQVIMSENRKFVACINANRITICDGQLKILSTIVEHRKIKSAAWDESGVLLYTTPFHVKYALTDGHVATLYSPPETLYAVAVRGKFLFCIDRACHILQIEFDPREFKFKQAVMQNDRAGILATLKQLGKLSRAEISFLVKKGYPGLALKFVDDANTRFPLALQAFDIDDALESAAKINSNECWQQLAEVAMQVGHIKAVERAYKELKKPYKLAMLYLVSGQRTELHQARSLAKELGDTSTEFIVSLILKDFGECAQIIRRCGYPNLAYTCAVNHGLYDLALELSQELSEEQLNRLPPLEKARSQQSTTSKTIQELGDLKFENWPLLNDELESFDAVLTEEPEIEIETDGEKGDWDDDDVESKLSSVEQDNEFEPLEDAQEDGWVDGDISDFGDDENVADEEKLEKKKYTPPLPGESITAEWSRVSDLALHHVFAGSYRTAFVLLQNQVGARDPQPLEPIFKELFLRSRAAYQGLAAYPTLYAYPITTESNPQQILPAGGYSFDEIEARLKESYGYFAKGKFSDAIDSFRSLLLRILFLQVYLGDSSIKAVENRIKRAKKLINVCREYILGLQVWLKRKQITGDDKRSCELAVYFSKIEMSQHLGIVLEVALKALPKLAKDYQKTQAAASIARRFLSHPNASDPSKAQLVAVAEKIKASLDVQVDQSLNLDFDDQNPYSLCALSYKPIMKNMEMTECPLCDAKYKPEYRNKICRICNLCEIGKACKGIRFMATGFDVIADE